MLAGGEAAVTPGEVIGLWGIRFRQEPLLKFLLAVIDPQRRIVQGDGVIYDNGWQCGLRALRRDRIGFSFRPPSQIPFLDVNDNVALFADAGRLCRIGGTQTGPGNISRPGCGNRAKAIPAQLSGGDQQRVPLPVV